MINRTKKVHIFLNFIIFSIYHCHLKIFIFQLSSSIAVSQKTVTCFFSNSIQKIKKYFIEIRLLNKYGSQDLP